MIAFDDLQEPSGFLNFPKIFFQNTFIMPFLDGFYTTGGRSTPKNSRLSKFYGSFHYIKREIRFAQFPITQKTRTAVQVSASILSDII
ncbi:MAG: hypothetical protein IKM00_06010 [Clostridia bacterium]|nr:hypothetical protein [Clostridia bacterium]